MARLIPYISDTCLQRALQKSALVDIFRPVLVASAAQGGDIMCPRSSVLFSCNDAISLISYLQLFICNIADTSDML